MDGETLKEFSNKKQMENLKRIWYHLIIMHNGSTLSASKYYKHKHTRYTTKDTPSQLHQNSTGCDLVPCNEDTVLAKLVFKLKTY